MPAPEPPAWLDELDLHVGPPDASMGTRVLDLADWFVVDEEWEPQRREAAAILDAHRAEVLVGTDDPRVAGPAAELLDLVRSHVPTPTPPGSGRGSEPPPPGSGRGSALAPGGALAEARLAVADDLCLLLPEGDRWVLAAGCVCFPSHWRPEAKVGRPLTEIHEGVPGYPGLLAGRVDAFLGRLAPGRAVRRRNWLVHGVPDLHLPGPSHRTDPRPDPAGGAAPARWLRSERQVLVRLAAHEAVAFTIRTQQVPVEVLAARPDLCAGLAAALRGWSPGQRAYKGHAVDDRLLGWLDERAAGAEATTVSSRQVRRRTVSKRDTRAGGVPPPRTPRST